MIRIETADLTRNDHAIALVELLDAYARDPMGGGQPLSPTVRDQLPKALAGRANALVLLAYVNDQPVGLLNAFEGFSTFRCQPLMNIHDIAVLPAYRGRGIAQALLQAVEQQARSRGCCKLTLEVLSGNKTAQSVYRRAGFAGYALDPAQGEALFWEKGLD